MSFEKMVNKTTFDVLQDMESRGVLNVLVKKGVVAIDWLDHLRIYKTFKQQLDQSGKIMESYHAAATIHSVHFKTVIYIRAKMES